jgi:hypothetical protein
MEEGKGSFDLALRTEFYIFSMIYWYNLLQPQPQTQPVLKPCRGFADFNIV